MTSVLYNIPFKINTHNRDVCVIFILVMNRHKNKMAQKIQSWKKTVSGVLNGDM